MSGKVYDVETVIFSAADNNTTNVAADLLALDQPFKEIAKPTMLSLPNILLFIPGDNLCILKVLDSIVYIWFLKGLSHEIEMSYKWCKSTEPN
jgi:hypothetical protein